MNSSSPVSRFSNENTQRPLAKALLPGKATVGYAGHMLTSLAQILSQAWGCRATAVTYTTYSEKIVMTQSWVADNLPNGQRSNL